MNEKIPEKEGLSVWSKIKRIFVAVGAAFANIFYSGRCNNNRRRIRPAASEVRPVDRAPGRKNSEARSRAEDMENMGRRSSEKRGKVVRESIRVAEEGKRAEQARKAAAGDRRVLERKGGITR